VKTRRLWLIVAALALLTPLGIWLPQRLGAGDAWGEWAAEDLQRQVGYLPRELGRLARFWSAPLPDYAPSGWEQKPFAHQGLAYVTSAFIGLAVCAAAMWLLGRWLARRGESRAP